MGEHGPLVYLEAHELENLMEDVRTVWGPPRQSAFSRAGRGKGVGNLL